MRHKRKRPSRRRLKARFMIGRPIAMEDIYNNRLDPWVRRHKYHVSQTMQVSRRR